MTKIYTPSTNAWTDAPTPDYDIEQVAQMRELRDYSEKPQEGEVYYTLMDDEGSRAYFEVGFRRVNRLAVYIGKDLGFEVGTQFDGFAK